MQIVMSYPEKMEAITEIQKQFFVSIIEYRYEAVLLPVYKKI